MVITGAGVLAANGIGKDAFWNSLLEGRSGVGPITLFDASDLPCRIAGELKSFDPAVYIEPALKPRRMGRFTQMALVAAREALADAGWTPEFLARTRGLPVVMGVSTSAMDVRAAPPALYSAVTGIPHAAGSTVAYACGIHARLLTVSDGCASSLDAVALGAALIRQGEADCVLAGGSDGALDHYVFQSMSKARKLSTRNDEPERADRPFDRDGDGGVAAEGAGLVTLENYETACARGAKIQAEITGYGSLADPPGSEEGEGLQFSMAAALANAGRRPADLQLILAHAPGDPHMDVTETRCIRQVLGRHAPAVPVVSIKGATGNPMGAGGVHQLITAAQVLQQGVIPATINFEHPAPGCDLDYVPGRPRRQEVRVVLVNTHGFGRGNSSLIVERVE